MTDQPRTIVFAVFPGVTQLDFTGPHQVLSRVPGFRPRVASAAGGQIVSDDGIAFATERLADVERCDVLCIPGGNACTDAMEDEAYMAEVGRLAGGATYVTSVCTGSLILGAAGLLQDRRAACHWAWRDHLSKFGATPTDERVVRDGNVITGGGVTAGIDFALTLASELTNDTVAQAIQLSLEYAPAPPFASGTPASAPEQITQMVRGLAEKAVAGRAAAIDRAAARLAGIA